MERMRIFLRAPVTMKRFFVGLCVLLLPTCGFGGTPGLFDSLVSFSQAHNLQVILCGPLSSQAPALPAVADLPALKAACEAQKMVVFESGKILTVVAADRQKRVVTIPAFAGIADPVTVSLEFAKADIRDVLRLLHVKSGHNIVVEKSVRGNLSIRAVDTPWTDVLRAIASGMGFAATRHGTVIYIADERRLPQILPDDVAQGKDPLVSFSLRDLDIREGFALLAKHFHRQNVAGEHVRGNVTLNVNQVSEPEALQLLARSNGFEARRFGDTWYLDDAHKLPDTAEKAKFHHRSLPPQEYPEITKVPEGAPLRLIVQGIVGFDKNWRALCWFQGRRYELTRGEIVQTAFRVTDVTADAVQVLDLRTQATQTFPLGGR
jgi:hypothetical protein